MNLKRDYIQKSSLLAAVIFTSIAPLLFLRLNEQTFSLNLFKLLAKVGSLSGTGLLIWQFILGYRLIGGRLVTDYIWLLNVHKSIGKYAIFLILLHPVFITFYYLGKYNINLPAFEQGLPFDAYLALGIVALLIIFIVIFTSVFLRLKMDFKSWYLLHITSYPAIILVFVHSLAIGQTIQETPLRIIWRMLFFLIIALFLYRIMGQFGLGTGSYTVEQVKHVGNDASQIVCRPVKNKVESRIGQFVYFRRSRREAGRPFTVSQYNPEQGSLSITVKAQGDYSTNLRAIEAGEMVFIDGPYGIFMQDALLSGRPLVMIAGGIGITPFYRLLTELQPQNTETYLFYGSVSEGEIIYKNELQRFSNVNIIHVISQQEDYEGEKGYVNLSIIKKYVRSDLRQCEFLLCGPPTMIVKIEQELLEENIPSKQIHHELFSF